MIRLATQEDLPTLAQMMVDLKYKSAWAQYHLPGYNYDSLLRFLQYQLTVPDSVCYVWVTSGEITGFCGGSLQPFVLPPHMSCVLEWGWDGSPKVCVHLWHALCDWGRERGAELAGRATAMPGSHSLAIKEQITWSKL